ncbi:MAG: sulfite exporter TauE/SafE family protein [Actinobacteria bacterium]|nr:sulfite exporter TauE/SafE family protein [Actinomycetota bacterium]
MYLPLVLAALAGVGIGVLSGLLGIGGGLLIIPLLRLGFGVPALTATATSLMTIIPTSIAGVIGHVRNKTANLKVGVSLGLVGALFAPIGTYLSLKVGGFVVTMVTVLVILYTAFTMFKKAARLSPASKCGDAETSCETQVAITHVDFDGKTIVQLTCMGAFVGLASGFLGLGGGFIIVPLTTWLFSFSMKEAAGTSLVALIFFATSGAISHGVVGNIEYLYAIAIALGTIPGALIGAALSKRTSERQLRLFFGILLVCVGISLAVEELGLF